MKDIEKHIKMQRHYFASKAPYRQSYDFSSSHVRAGQFKKRLSKEELMPLNCGAGENSWKASPLDSKEIKPVNPKGYQLWIFTGRTNAEAEAKIIKGAEGETYVCMTSPLISFTWWEELTSLEKTLMLGKIEKGWGQEDKRMTKYEMVGWHHWLNGPEFEQSLGYDPGQGNLACCSS